MKRFTSNPLFRNGCQKVFFNYYICLSSGYPPMPASIANAVCGPQVNDTASAPSTNVR